MPKNVQTATQLHSSHILASESESRSVGSDSLQPHGLYSPWNSPGQNTEEGSCSLIQAIFPTQGSNPGLPHCKWILYQLSHRGSPHAGKVMLKILQVRLQQYVNCELPDVQAGFRKGRVTRDQISNIHWIIEKVRDSRKTSIFALLTTPRPLTVWITANCGKFFKRWEYQTT